MQPKEEFDSMGSKSALRGRDARFTKLLLATLTLSVMISLLGNVWLYRSMRAYAGRARTERMDLLSGQYFAPANASLVTQKPEGVRMVFAGDSDVALWDPLPTVKGTQIVKRGWGGDRSGDLLLRLERDVVELRPDVAVLTIGGNDLEDIALLPDQEDAIIETCERNIRVIVDHLRQRHIHVVLLTILPYGDVPLNQRIGWSNGTYRGVQRVNEMLRTMGGPGVTVLDCDPILAQMNGRRIPTYSRDVMHVNTAGYQAVNEALVSVLKSLVKQVRP